MRGAIEMSNEEKILAELAAIRAELATVQSEVVTMRAEVERLNGKVKEPVPTSAEQLDVLRRLNEEFPFTDEENEAFGKYMEELEN